MVNPEGNRHGFSPQRLLAAANFHRRPCRPDAVSHNNTSSANPGRYIIQPTLNYSNSLIEGSLQTSKKQKWEEESEKRKEEEKKSEKRQSQKKEDAGARKGRKVAKHCVFPLFCGSGGSKSKLAKAAGRWVRSDLV
jgi:hypothetical protein